MLPLRATASRSPSSVQVGLRPMAPPCSGAAASRTIDKRKREPRLRRSRPYLPVPSWIVRAGNGTRTRDPNLGKVVLYQLSYSRVTGKITVILSEAKDPLFGVKAGPSL